MQLQNQNNLFYGDIGLLLREMWSIDCSSILLCMHVILTALIINPVS